MKPEARKPRGFVDRNVTTCHLDLVQKLLAVYQRWGFQYLETPMLEYADALGKFLPDQDRPNAGVFSLKDDDDQWLSLRYDLTAPLARYVAESFSSLNRPYRRCSAGPVWRNEKPGPGRLREFWQCDADTVGSSSFVADAEMIAMGYEALVSLGLDPSKIKIELSNRKLVDGLIDAIGIPADQTELRLAIFRTIDKLDRLGEEGVTALLGEGRKDESGSFTKGVGLEKSQISKIYDFFNDPYERDRLLQGFRGQEGLYEIDAVMESVKSFGAVASVNPSIVRGLAYYTGNVFEIRMGTSALALGGGGRYDKMISRFMDTSLPATGFSLGVTRLADVIVKDIPMGPVVVASMDKENTGKYIEVVQRLRRAGISAELYIGETTTLKGQLKYADDSNSPAVVMLGSDELAKGTVSVKDMRKGKRASDFLSRTAWVQKRGSAQIEVPNSDLIDVVQKIIG